MNAVMDDCAASSRFRYNAKCRLTSLLNVAEVLFAAGNGSRVDRNELVALKETLGVFDWSSSVTYVLTNWTCLTILYSSGTGNEAMSDT